MNVLIVFMKNSMNTILAVATLLPGGLVQCPERVLVGTSEDEEATLRQFRQKGGGA